MKPFSDGEFLKRGILIAVNALCPKKKHLFYDISLSRNTVTVSVTKDGAPAMVGMRKGFVSLLEKYIKEPGVQNQIIKIHCIIHQEALCPKYLHMQEVMNILVKVVNLI